MLQTAANVRSRGFNYPKRNKLSLETHIKIAFPFHKLFCDFTSSNITKAYSKHSFEKKYGAFVTNEIPLEKRRKNDEGNLVFARLLITA